MAKERRRATRRQGPPLTAKERELKRLLESPMEGGTSVDIDRRTHWLLKLYSLEVNKPMYEVADFTLAIMLWENRATLFEKLSLEALKRS